MEKCNLTDLPNELLTQILSNIHGQSQLAKIALLSKRFKALVDLLLYRHISLDIQYSAKDFRNTRIVNRYSHTNIPSFLPFDRLIDTFSLNPNFGQQVRTLSLKVHQRLWYKLFAADIRLLKLLPELRTLSLSPPPYHSSIPHSNWTLTSLRLDFSLVSDHYNEESDWLQIGVPLRIIASYLWLPNLRKVQAEEALFTSNFNDTRCLVPGGSSVEDLRFLKCREQTGDRVLAALLRSTKSLRRFVFEVSSVSYRNAQLGPNAGAFEIALSEHRETIEELAVATGRGLPVLRWALGPFTQWTSLKRLAVPGFMILGTASGTRNLYHALPPLLEELQMEYPTVPNNWTLMQMARQAPSASSYPRIASYESIVDAARAKDVTDMRQLAENKEFYVPRLNHVIWWYQKAKHVASDYPLHCIDASLAGLTVISSAFEKVGVKFEWISEPSFKDTPFGKRLCQWPE